MFLNENLTKELQYIIKFYIKKQTFFKLKNYDELIANEINNFELNMDIFNLIKCFSYNINSKKIIYKKSFFICENTEINIFNNMYEHINNNLQINIEKLLFVLEKDFYIVGNTCYYAILKNSDFIPKILEIIFIKNHEDNNERLKRIINEFIRNFDLKNIEIFEKSIILTINKYTKIQLFTHFYIDLLEFSNILNFDILNLFYDLNKKKMLLNDKTICALKYNLNIINDNILNFSEIKKYIKMKTNIFVFIENNTFSKNNNSSSKCLGILQKISQKIKYKCINCNHECNKLLPLYRNTFDFNNDTLYFRGCKHLKCGKCSMFNRLNCEFCDNKNNYLIYDIEFNEKIIFYIKKIAIFYINLSNNDIYLKNIVNNIMEIILFVNK